MKGPVVLAAIIGKRQSRRYCCESRQHSHMQSILSEGLAKMHIELPTSFGDTLFGFAFLESWNIEVTSDTSYDQALLTVLNERNRRRRGSIRLQHRVKLALHLMRPMSIDCAAATADSLRGLWQQCLSCSMRVSGPGIPSRIVFVADHDRTIGDAVKEHGAVVHSWPLPHLVAVSICAGLCGSDFSVVCQRTSGSLAWLPPHLPSNLKSIVLPEQTVINVPTPTRSFTDRQSALGLRAPYPVEAKIADTEVTVDLKSICKVDMAKHVAKVDRLQQCLENAQVPEVHRKIQNMCEYTRLRNFYRLDVSAMLAQREVSAEKGPFFRFLATDKGPQKKCSWELLNTVEVVIPRSEVIGKSLLDIDASQLQKRKLAPCCMAQSGTDLPNTVCSMLHQIWLDYGPTAYKVKLSNSYVIGVGTDLGTEAAIADHHDMTDWLVDSISASVTPPQPGPCKDYLFPRALKVAGPLHCIDWVIRASFNKIQGFVQWLLNAKTILQYMHSKTHRVFMTRKLRSLRLPDAVAQQCKKDLANGCGRFADWRWRSLQICSKDLARYELSICSTCGGDNLKDFHLSRNARAGVVFKLVTEDQSFFRFNELLAKLLGPVMILHGWTQGCPCHPINGPEDSRPPDCPFQGLNCKGFSGKIAETIAAYDTMRRNGSLDRFGEYVDVHEIIDIIGFIIAMLVLKLQRWVDDLPYLIWQVTVYFLIMLFTFSVF